MFSVFWETAYLLFTKNGSLNAVDLSTFEFYILQSMDFNAIPRIWVQYIPHKKFI